MELISSASPSITDLMRTIQLSPTFTLPSCRFLTQDQLRIIFKVLLDDMLVVIKSLPATPQVVQGLAERLLMNVLHAARNPYVDAVEEAQKIAEKALKRIEEARQETKGARKETREAWKETREARKETKEARQEAKEARQATEKARENFDRQSQKEREDYAKKSQKEREDLAKQSQNDREYFAKQSQMEREDLDRQSQKEGEDFAKQSQKERENFHRQSQQAQAKIEEPLDEKYNLLSEPKMASHDSVKGSAKCAQKWMKALEKNADQQNLDIPALPKGALIRDEGIRDLHDKNYTCESDMYRLFLPHAQKYFNMHRTEGNPGTKIWDRHRSRSLSGYLPDLTITLDNAWRPDPYSIIAMWEMKLGTLDDGAKGQMYDCLKIVGRKQPQRRRFVGILSNFKENFVITLTRSSSNNKLEALSYKLMTTAYAISYLREIIKDKQYHPVIPGFSIELGVMDHRLGNEALNEVAVFKTPNILLEFANGRWINPDVTSGDGVSTIVVKRTVRARGSTSPRLVYSEIEILKLICTLGGHKNLPRLFYYSLDYQEFGIEPHGYPVKPGETLFHWREVLVDVLSALRWLHSQHIIHRDVRWDNIIWARDHAVLIDLGAAVYCSPTQPIKCLYVGGFICCPPRLLGKFHSMYLPDAADDCHAVVLLVIMLCWPERWKGVRGDLISGDSSDVTLKLIKFWTDARASGLWGEYVAAAESVSYSHLEEMLDIFLYYAAPNVRDVLKGRGWAEHLSRDIVSMKNLGWY